MFPAECFHTCITQKQGMVFLNKVELLAVDGSTMNILNGGMMRVFCTRIIITRRTNHWGCVISSSSSCCCHRTCNIVSSSSCCCCTVITTSSISVIIPLLLLDCTSRSR